MRSKKSRISKNVRSVQTKLTIITVGSLFLVFFLVASLGYYHHYNTTIGKIKNDLVLISTQKTIEYNNCLESVERSVEVMKNHILGSIDAERLQTDKKYEQQYMENLTKLLTEVSVMSSDVVAAYFRPEPERYGGTMGVLITGNKKNGFISVRPTNLSLYTPSDIDHVGWFYLPVWKGSSMWIEPYENKNLNIHMISYVAPIYLNNKLLGVVGMDINMATLKGIADAVPLQSAGALLLGVERNLVYSTDYRLEIHPAETSNELRYIRTLITDSEDSMYRFGWNGKKQFGSSVALRNGMTLVVCISETELKDEGYLLLGKMSATFLAVLTIALLVLVHSYREIFTPISEMTEASYRLSRGELGISIAYHSNNELGVLANSIRKMATQLREYIDFIREQAQSEREAKENALNASKAKSDFLANMSHEIRTPINAVLGMDEMILRESNDDAIRQYAVNIKQAGNSLLGIINDVLDFSKIESGKMDLLPETYDISSILVDLVTIISDRARRKKLALELHINPDIPKLLVGDSIRIKQCILNLLTNAVKYTMEGKVIFTVDYSTDILPDGKHGIWLRVMVEDTGIGIKESDIEKLFAPFERIEENRNRTIEGTGLGLNIVQKILVLMGSKLDVRSEYGKGSVFSFSVWQDVTDVEPIGDIMEAYHKRVMFMEKYTEKLFAPRARILFVDDTVINLEVVKGLLKNTKIQLDTATSGKETLEKVRQNTYDILFIDHRMPEMDGMETLMAIQNLSDNKCLGKPCIALTANAINGAREMYLAAGFTDYLSKPVSPEKLEEMIIRYLPPEYIESPEGHAEPESKEKKQTESPVAQKSYEAADESSFIPQIEGIDSSVGIQNCGETELFVEMLGLVYQGIDENKQAIEDFLEKEDWENYRIKVHSLKSTSRLIGALELSDKAALLEKAATDGNIDFIKEKTEEVLLLYETFRQKLEAYAPADDGDIIG